MRLFLRAFAFLLALAGPAFAEIVHVAVAANFRATLAELQPAFETASGHELRVSTGPTGLLYAQIVRGAPFDVFLAADQARPAALIEAGLADPASRFTYVRGRLAFIARDSALVSDDGPVFDAISTLSIANPRTAPYGAAALQALQRLSAPHLRIAQAHSVAGVDAAVISGAADAGIAALSSARTRRDELAIWVIPAELHDPIRQDAVLLARAASDPGPRSFLAWLASPGVRATLATRGYDVD